MINVAASTVINRPITEAFGFVSSFENHPKWQTNVQEARLLKSTPTGVGTAYQCVFDMPGGKTAASKLEIVEYKANQKITFEAEVVGPMKPNGSYLCETVAGGTKITLLPRPEFRGLFRLLESVISGPIRKNHIAYLSNLKRLLES